MSKFEVNEKKMKSGGVKIVVVGVGGGGCNMVENLIDSDSVDDVKLVAINTDAQALKNSKIPNKLQIGEKITKGRGAGMKPEVGKEAALENYDEIKEMLRF